MSGELQYYCTTNDVTVGQKNRLHIIKWNLASNKLSLTQKKKNLQDRGEHF